MKILVGGASGLVGSALVPYLASQGHEAVRLVRGRPAQGDLELEWNPDAGTIDSARLEGIEAVVNLAGASIAKWPWTAAHGRLVLESRVRSAALLAKAISAMSRKPRVFLSASAVGYYGDRGDDLLLEGSSPGSGFFPEVCVAWETAARKAETAGIRVVPARIGMILSGTGGALPMMRGPFRLGLGGIVGSGRQFISWIALEDLVAAIAHVLTREEIRGPLNVVSPEPVRNAEFTKALGSALHRPTIFPVPAFVVGALLGEMGRALLLASQRVDSTRLTQSGFAFRFPSLDGTLRHALARDP